MRGDCAFGNDALMTALEQRGQPQISKLPQSCGVQKLRCPGLALTHFTPGMAVSVEIKTGKRCVIEYVLSPLLQYKQESSRER